MSSSAVVPVLQFCGTVTVHAVHDFGLLSQNRGQGLGFKITFAGVVDKHKLYKVASGLLTVFGTVYTYLIAMSSDDQ